MKRIILLSIAISMLFSVNTFAADETFTASIVIRTAITITKNADLDFGTVVADSANSQDIVVAATDPGAASFDIIGEATTATFSISNIVNLTNGGNTITLSNFALSQGTGNLDPVTALTVTVGATATVAANQAAGTYNGGATFNVVYN